MPELIGKTLGKYRVVARLGRGGMAEVYKAYQPGLDRYVAIKVLHRHLAEDHNFIDRFEREARSIANLRHPNIVQVFDFDAENDVYYMAMEYIDGPTLKAELKARSDNGRLFTLAEITRLMGALCEAIDYAHNNGMVHRDLKPANFILNTKGQILILDFGIAKIVDATKLTATGAMAGTPTYMSPEQGQGERGDERSDIYSLGVVLYEMVTGRVPYDADTPFAVIMKHITEPLPLPSSLNAQIPENVERIILKALSKNPDDRFQTGAQLANALSQAVGLSPYDKLNNNPVVPIAMLPPVAELKPTDPTFHRRTTAGGGTVRGQSSPTMVSGDTGAAATVMTVKKKKKTGIFIGLGIGLIIVLLALVGFLLMTNQQQQNQMWTSAQTETAVAAIPPSMTPTATATSMATETPSPAATDAANQTTVDDPTATPNLDATLDARFAATAQTQATETAVLKAAIEAVEATERASQPTEIPSPTITLTPQPTNTSPPTATSPPAATATATTPPLPTNTPAPTNTPTPNIPAVSGKIAVPVDNGLGRYDLWLFDIITGDILWKAEGARQPVFREDGVQLLVNGEGTGRDNIWLLNGASGVFEKSVSGSPTDSHPFFNPSGNRVVYGNPNLAIGSDGSNHPFIFVQCGLNSWQEEGDKRCNDVGQIVLVPAGQIGEIHGSNPVWTGDDRIVYRGCDTWKGGGSCGLFIVGSWANKGNSNGETPVKLAGTDGTSTTPTDAQGTNILFHSLESGNWEVYLTTISGGVTNLTNNASANDGLGTFSPDGNWVAFVSDRDGGWAVWVTPTTGGAATKLFDLPAGSWGAGDHDWTNERISWAP